MSWLVFWIALCSPIGLLAILGAKDWLLKKLDTERQSTTTIRAAQSAAT
jgi:hypothetical protein